MSDFSKVESVIAAVLVDVSSAFPDDTVKNVQELLAHGEPGIALETLCTQLAEYEIEVSPDITTRLRAAACLMGISISDWDGPNCQQ